MKRGGRERGGFGVQTECEKWDETEGDKDQIRVKMKNKKGERVLRR